MSYLKQLYSLAPIRKPIRQVGVSNIRPYYLLAVFILITVTGLSYLSLRQFTASQESYGSLINLSGRQRMLSQRIALVTTQLVFETDSADRVSMRTELLGLIARMTSVHEGLVTGNLPGEFRYQLSPELATLYFSEPVLLDQRVRDYLLQADHLIGTVDANLNPANADFVSLTQTASELLIHLDAAVAQYQLEEDRHVMQLARQEIFSFVTLLGVLGLITGFIFYPMEKRIHQNQIALLTEIDMRREAERMLLKSETLYRLMANNLPGSAVMLFDRDLRYLLAEGPILEEAGYSKFKMEGRTIYEVLPATAAEAIAPLYQSALDGQEVDFERSTPDKVYHARIVAVRDDQGRITGGLLVIQDITLRKQAEAKLRESEYFIHQIASTVPDIVYIYDVREQRNIYANREVGEVIGYNTQAMQAMGSAFVPSIMYPDDLANFPAHMQDVAQVKDDVILEFEYRMKSAQGTWRWFNSRDIVFARDPDGNVTQILGVARDITLRREAELALQESEERFRQIAETIRSVFWIVEPQSGKILYISPAYETIWGRSRQEYFGSGLSMMQDIHPEDRERVSKERQTNIQTGNYNIEYRIIRPDGQIRWINSTSYPILDENGKITRVVGTSDDVTERRELQHQAFTDAIERERVELLSDFIRDTSHDLRTPLTIMATSLYLLRRDSQSEEQAPRFDLIEQQINRLNQLITDLHTMADLDTTTHIEKWESNVNQLVSYLYGEYSKKALELNKSIRLDLQPDLPLIQVNERTLNHALINLLNNALEYTEDGGTITVGTELVNEQEIVISVRDDGVGIAEEHLDLIFDRLFKVDSARNARSGPGLGLAMVRRLMELHGGRVEVESAIGKGSIFRLRIPVGVGEMVGVPS